MSLFPRPHADVWHLGHRAILAVLGAALLAFGLWCWVDRPAWSHDDITAAGNPAIAGFAFSPFRAGQSPARAALPDDRQIRADLRRLAPLTHRIRTYTVSGTLGDIPRLAAPLGMRVSLGVWLDGKPAADASEIRRAIVIANHASNIEAVIVGNETLLRGDLRPAELIGDIKRVKAAVHVPVTTAEPWHIWLAHPELAAAVDEITVHILPYWEGVPEHAALADLRHRLTEIRTAYPGKPIIVGEVGWPSQGQTVGGAVASPTNQARFIRAFLAAAPQLHVPYFLMEAYDQPWKMAFEGQAGGYWGLFTLARSAKFAFSGPVWDHPAWLAWASGAIALGGLLGAAFLGARSDLSWRGMITMAVLCQGVATGAVIAPMLMGELYLSRYVALAWSGLIFAQFVLFALLLADGFELVEALFAPRRRTGLTTQLATAPDGIASTPFVSIHMPICDEPPAMVCRSLDALSRLDYPDFEVLVIDNNSSGPAIWEPVALHCARLGARFRFLHLGAWPGHKAGALNEALRHTDPQAGLIAVLDADYQVSPDWLRAAVPAFTDPGLGFLQSPQDYRDGTTSLFKRLIFWEYAGFFAIGMQVRNDRNAIIQHGTMTLIRREALIGVGGWAEWSLTEDAELGLRLLAAGWRSLYRPASLGKGVMPDDLAAWRRQRARWAFGAMQICRHHAATLFRPAPSGLSLGQRWHFIAGWLPWLADALGLVFLFGSMGFSLALIADPGLASSPALLFVLPSLIAFVFRLIRMFVLYRRLVACGWRERIGSIFAGLAVTHSIGFAVIAGLMGRKRPFFRTAKLQPRPNLTEAIGQIRLELGLLATGMGLIAALLCVLPQDRASSFWILLLGVQLMPSIAAVFMAGVTTLRQFTRLPAGAAHLAR